MLVCDFSNANQMPNNVRDAVVEIVETEGGRSKDDAEEYVKYLEQTKRYQVECWSWPNLYCLLVINKWTSKYLTCNWIIVITWRPKHDCCKNNISTHIHLTHANIENWCKMNNLIIIFMSHSLTVYLLTSEINFSLD